MKSKKPDPATNAHAGARRVGQPRRREVPPRPRRSMPSADKTQAGARDDRAVQVVRRSAAACSTSTKSAALVPNIDEIVAIAKSDDAMPGDAADDAVKLLRVIRSAHLPASRRWYRHDRAPALQPEASSSSAADSALKCGGLKAIKDVVHALPDGPYDQQELDGWRGRRRDRSVMTPRPARSWRPSMRRSSCRGQRESGSSRWVAIEGLAAMKSTEDAPRIALANLGSGEKLVGYWGDQKWGRRQIPQAGTDARSAGEGAGGTT